ncbi:MAG: hypothetical protein GY832_34190 [Chloroflexi bacterium]|nr:hypothetical protein [Chloroflexota bacterium]
MSIRHIAVVALIILILVTGCGKSEPTATPSSPTVAATPILPTATPVPSSTPQAETIPTLASGPTIAVPYKNPPILDGVLSPGEWDNAQQETFSDGSELLLMHDGNYLYLGIRASTDDLFVPTVCVDRGNEMIFLHSSAALGDAFYERAEDDWQLTKPFEWILREGALESHRESFLQDKGWLASLARVGTLGEIEFQIAIPEGSARIAVAYLLSPNYSPIWWPADLADDCRNFELLSGNDINNLQFSPELWVTVMAADTGETGALSVNGNDEVVFYSDRDGRDWEIYVMPISDETELDDSDPQQLTDNSAHDALPRWSPDKEKILFQSERDGNWDIYVMNADGSEQQRLTHSDAGDEYPSWSPDGTEIIFSSNRDGNYELYVLNVAAGGTPQRLTNNDTGEFQAAWSPDGTRIAFASDRDGNDDIYIMAAPGGSDVVGSNEQRLTYDSGWDLYPAWSPDGKQIAFQSYRDGNWNIYVMNVADALQSNATDDSSLQQLTDHHNDDEFPAWSPDGTQIAYESDRGSEELYVMNSDGSDQRPLTRNRVEDYGPDW